MRDQDGRADLAPRSTERGNLPWDDRDFSRRMLAEHLDQAHDAASRRLAIIDRQVDWIHRTLLAGSPTRILDLGCGPGLYTGRLARLGHTCHGIDIGPASIEHARITAERDALACTYALGDLRTVPFDHPGGRFGLVVFLYGEPSVFSPAQLASVLTRAAEALAPGGVLLVELHTERGVAAIGDEPATERWLERGLFLDAPHRLATDARFDPHSGVATRRWVVTPEDGAPTEHRVSYQAYSDRELTALLATCGFDSGSVRFHPDPLDRADPSPFQLVTAARACSIRVG